MYINNKLYEFSESFADNLWDDLNLLHLNIEMTRGDWIKAVAPALQRFAEAYHLMRQNAEASPISTPSIQPQPLSQIAGTPAAQENQHKPENCHPGCGSPYWGNSHHPDCERGQWEREHEDDAGIPDLSCLLCGHVKDKAVIHNPSGQYVCFGCRDAAMMGTRAEALLKDAEAYIRRIRHRFRLAQAGQRALHRAPAERSLPNDPHRISP